MSTKDIAYAILDTFSEEKLEAFITLFGDESTIAKAKSEMIATDPKTDLYRAFKENISAIYQEVQSNPEKSAVESLHDIFCDVDFPKLASFETEEQNNSHS